MVNDFKIKYFNNDVQDLVIIRNYRVTLSYKY